MKIALMKRLIPIATAAFSLFWIYLGVNVYGFWDEVNGPSGGFFPVIIGCVLLMVSIVTLINERKNTPPEFNKDSFVLITAVILIFASTFVIGLLPSMGIFLIVWLRWLEKESWKMTMIATSVMSVIVIGVFVLWLGVYFPTGILFEMITG